MKGFAEYLSRNRKDKEKLLDQLSDVIKSISKDFFGSSDTYCRECSLRKDMYFTFVIRLEIQIAISIRIEKNGSIEVSEDIVFSSKQNTFNINPGIVKKRLFNYFLNHFFKQSEFYEPYFNLSKEVQEKVLEQRPDLIGRIKNLDPELKEKYKTSKKGAEAGFF